MVVGELGQESLAQAIVDLRNKQVFFVSLNPDMNEEAIRKDVSFHTVANILAKCLNVAMGGDIKIQISSDNLHAPAMGIELIEFLAESCDAPPPEEGDEDGVDVPGGAAALARRDAQRDSHHGQHDAGHRQRETAV